MMDITKRRRLEYIIREEFEREGFTCHESGGDLYAYVATELGDLPFKINLTVLANQIVERLP